MECKQCNNHTTVGQNNHGSSFNLGMFNAMVVDSLGIVGLAARICRILVISLRYMLYMVCYSQCICKCHHRHNLCMNSQKTDFG